MNLHNVVSVLFWRLCRLLPVNRKKVLFSSYYGHGYSDSPKAIAQALLDSGSDLKLCWLVNSQKEATSLPEGIHPVSNTVLRRVLAISTAKVWVDNCRKYERYKRKEQFYLQTWHGFALKRIEEDVADVLEPEYIEGCKKDSTQCDLMVSNSAFMSKLYRTSFWYDGEIAEYGFPRNDVFFSQPPEIRGKVLSHFGLSLERKLVLYAPTFRADHSTDCYRLAAESLLNACESRFSGKWALLVRLHPNVAGQSQGLFAYDNQRIFDATAYPDMQELLCAADLLITDYSSSMFDYALSRRPCLQFALDIEDYRKDRNFYFPLDQLPFPLATSNEALVEAIEHFDMERYLTRWDRFRWEQAFCEDGQAARRCAQWILNKINGKDKL